MSNNGSVKINRRLFGLLCKYFLLGCRNLSTEEEICRELQWKLDKLAAHDRYSQSLVAKNRPDPGR